MSEAMRVAKMNAGYAAKGDSGVETAEVAEAIKALQTQLADLRKIVQAAKMSHRTEADAARRQ